jgi:hypothetical protein
VPRGQAGGRRAHTAAGGECSGRAAAQALCGSTAGECWVCLSGVLVGLLVQEGYGVCVQRNLAALAGVWVELLVCIAVSCRLP